MLTADLVRAQVRKGLLLPRWIDPTQARLLDGAAALIALHQQHIGKQSGELDDAVLELTVAESDPLLWKGLVKLLSDRTTTETRAPIPPATLRAAVFREAGARWPIGPASRAEVLAKVAAELGIDVEAIEVGLYADRPTEQWVTAFEAPEPAALLREYNLALAQAALFRASEVTVELPELEPKRARALFRELKFRRLLARIAPAKEGWKLTLDGPLSLLRQTSRYGLQLALFLPALVRCPRWRLEAEVTLGGRGAGRPARLVLSEESPLEAERGHHDDGVWTSPEEEHFVRGMEALETPWKLERGAVLVDLDGRDVLLPDYVLRHPDGREALLELVWSWRRAGFVKRLDLLAAHGPPNLVVAWAEKGGLDLAEGAAPGPDLAPSKAGGRALHLVRFKGVVPPRRIVEMAEAVGVAAARAVAPAKARKRAAKRGHSN
ncbi:MAG: DUF790 family protein [Myxococcota bacterium]